tara:strand:- start:885 stop:1733 length:849 start_codon:yes stop_codon:yes gene_type:complete
MSAQYVLRTKDSKFDYTPKYFQGMKNVMVFVSVDFDKVKVEDGWSYMKDDDYMNKTIRFIKAQIDNSIELNWKVEDIILATNFEFEYRGVKSILLEKTCSYSQFFNKEYAILELLEKGIVKDTNLWYHDLDAFQLEEFEFPKFDGDWGTCVYPNYDGHSCQCGVFYIKPTAIDIFKDMVDRMERDEFGTTNDEIVVRNFIKLNPTYAHRVSVLDTSFNMGNTEYVDRYRLATKPLKVVHFSADDERQWDMFANGNNDCGVPFINDRLKSIIEKYDLNYKENQ